MKRTKRQKEKALEKELGCKFIRINLYEKDFNTSSKVKNEIFRHIKESIKKLTEKALIDKLSNKLLRLEFKSTNSIQTNCLKYVVKNILPTL